MDAYLLTNDAAVFDDLNGAIEAFNVAIEKARLQYDSDEPMPRLKVEFKPEEDGWIVHGQWGDGEFVVDDNEQLLWG